MTTASQLAGYASSLPNFRNRIINGDMRIDQRNAGASITATNGICLDRWTTRSSQASKYSVQQSTDSPNGLNYSLKATSLSSYSITASDYFTIDQRIETGNIQDFGWGNANGKSATLSFWVKSSLTGTFAGSISNYNGNPTYGFTYQVLVSDTWEKKFISIPCPTIGSWSTTINDGYCTIAWGLGVGSNETSTSNNSWLDENKRAGTGGVSVVGTSGATWYLTGVQLEVGNQATPFEHRPYGLELGLCQRYYNQLDTAEGGSYRVYEVYGTTGGGDCTFCLGIHKPMRVTPTVTSTGHSTANITGYGGLVSEQGVINIAGAYNAAGRTYWYQLTADANGQRIIKIAAEL